MAMTKCRECGNDVSNKAAACPKCGNPIKVARKGISTGSGCLVVFVAVFALAMVMSAVRKIGGEDSAPSTPPSNSKTTAPTRAAATTPARKSDAECRKDLECWADRHRVEAAVQCKRAIEQQAKWQYEWTTGMFSPMFVSYGWANEQRTHISYFGDRLKLQNGFGAWSNVKYGCTFDTAAQTVVAVAAE